jgi:hypothetical protein
VIVLANGRIAAQGTPDQVAPFGRSAGPPVRARLAEGPVHFHYPGPSVAEDFSEGLGNELVEPVRRRLRRAQQAGGHRHAARLLARLLSPGGPHVRARRLVRDQVHFLGNFSLAIIGVSGLFVGFVLACRATTSCSATARPKRWA